MVKIINAYRVQPPSKKACADAAIYRGYDWLVDESGNYAEPIHQSNFTKLGFLEILADSPFDVTKFECANGQAPYLEIYLDDAKDEVLYNPNVSSKNRLGSLETLPHRFRVLFFLHFLKQDAKCSYDGIELEMPTIQRLPDKLSKHAQYIPVD